MRKEAGRKALKTFERMARSGAPEAADMTMAEINQAIVDARRQKAKEKTTPRARRNPRRR
jgi:hypothetical protein